MYGIASGSSGSNDPVSGAGCPRGSFKNRICRSVKVGGNASRSTTSYWLQPAISDRAGGIWRGEEPDKRVSRINIPGTYGDTGGEHRDFLNVGRQRYHMIYAGYGK